MSQPSTVLERVRAHARQRPEADALRRCDGTSALRYGQLLAETDRLAASLGGHSITRGSRVLVISDNGPETYLSVLACAKLGAIAVMVDGNSPAATIERFAELTAPGAILVAPVASLDGSNLPETLAPLPTITVTIAAVAHDAVGDGIDWIAEEPEQCSDDPLAMIFTSGTTGDPKAVLLPNRTFYAVADILHRERLDWIDWIVGETTYSPLPATHIGGLWWIFNCLMQGSVCVTGGEHTSSLLEILVTNEVATTCLVPTLLSRLVTELNATNTAVPSSLRFVGYGGSRAVASDVEYVEAAGVRTAQVYGLSETGCTALCLPTGTGSIAKIEAGAVGRPYPGVKVHLGNADGKRPDATGAAAAARSGTLWINSPANMLGYWNNLERTQDTLVDGWINTGDLLELDDDGYFYIRGRSSEMIISGGVNIAPDQVDRIAESVAGVRDAACYEIPDPEFGALVGLAVVASIDLDAAAGRQLKRAIAAQYRQESESVARPSGIVFVSEIPRTQSGKVMRASLATALAGDEAEVGIGG